MTVEFNVLDRKYEQHKDEYNHAVMDVLKSGWYILGKKVETFEIEFASYIGTKYCVGLNSGLDALILAFRALNIKDGDEVIVPANTYIASVLGITENGATPVFVEPNEFYNINPQLIEEKITPKTKAILVVHLYGQACQMDVIAEIAQKHSLYIIEDCAQSHGACFNGRMTGSYGHIGCFSFFPTKNMGAFGDAGAITTDDYDHAQKIRMIRNYGSKEKYVNELEGVNSRLDEMQAAILSVELKHINDRNNERKNIAQRYLNGIKNPCVILPEIARGCDDVFHLFIIRVTDCTDRNNFINHLMKNGIKTAVHYPIPPHLSKCYGRLGYINGDFPITENYANSIVSLPMYIGMSENEVNYVIDCINAFTI